MAKRQSKGQKASGGRKVVAEQWVEVRIRSGRTVTELTPTNDQLRKQMEEMDPAAELVYRRFNFPEGVPAEYEWTDPDENMRQYGGGGLQRMTVETWLNLSWREAENGAAHVGMTGVGNLPRPKEHGGCECEVCRQNAYLAA